MNANNSDYVPGWVDLATPDLTTAQDFYSQVLGWTYEERTDPVSGDYIYTMCQKDGKYVAGMYPLGEEMKAQGVPPHWMPYLLVSDCDDACRRVEDAGGKVMMGPMDVMDQGRMAVWTDSQGATCGFWTPGLQKGFELKGVEGAYDWCELYANDVGAAKDFLTSAFGWESTAEKMPNGTEYMMFQKGGEMICGMMLNPVKDQGVPSSWGVYFRVDDCKTATENARRLGAEIVVEPMDIGEGRAMSTMMDPCGAIVNVGSM